MSQEHSAEPWSIDAALDGDVKIVDQEGNDVVGYTNDFAGHNGPIVCTFENLKRIAACVNWCQHVPTEVIKGLLESCDTGPVKTVFPRDRYRAIDNIAPPGTVLYVDLEVAILSGDPQLIEACRNRLQQLAEESPAPDNHQTNE